MKRMILITILTLLASMLLVTPVLGADPPGMNVDINIGTPSDVDLDMDINARGYVDITIDGVDFKETAYLAQSAYNVATKPQNRMWDYGYYWQVSGIGPMVEGQLNQLNGAVGLLLDASAALIQGRELTGTDITNIRAGLDILSQADIGASEAISALQDRNEAIWNQLMNGAEYHIGLLEIQAAEQQTEIVGLQTQVDTISAELEAATANNAMLINHISYTQQRYDLAILVLSVAVVLLGIGLTVTGIVIRQRKSGF